jgi:hypothetical protein
MSVCKRLIIVFCLCLMSGCYEDFAEVILNNDGSGTIKQKYILSERIIVVASDGSSRDDTPPATKEKLLEKIGPALEVKKITQDELADGGRSIEFEGTFRNPEQFFLSQYCQEQLKLRLAPAETGKAAIYWDMVGLSDGFADIRQLYGIAKGLYVTRKIHLPGQVEKTNECCYQAGNVVEWSADLRDKKGLDKTEKFIKGPDKGKGFAVFDASGLRFTLPLKVSELAKRTERQQSDPNAPTGLSAEVAKLSMHRTYTVDGDYVPEDSYLEFTVELSWSEGKRPARCEKPVLLSLTDDTGNDLIDKSKSGSSSVKIYSHQKSRQFKLKAKAPEVKFKSLSNLQGYIETITAVKTEMIVLENLHKLAGKESTAIPSLDKLNFQVNSIEHNTLTISVDGGNETIESLELIKEDGIKIKRSGGMGMGDQYTYEFKRDIPKPIKCELEVVFEKSKVKVPFSSEVILLPLP